MILQDQLVIIERLDRIEKKIDSKMSDRWMSTKEVSAFTGLSIATIQRALTKGELKVSRSTGKNLFRRSWIDKWLGGGK